MWRFLHWQMVLSDKYDKNTKFETGTDYRSVMPQFTEKGIEQNRELLTLLREISASKNATPAQISLAWMLCKSHILCQFRNKKSGAIKENAFSADILLTDDEVKALDKALNSNKNVRCVWWYKSNNKIIKSKK